MKELEGSNEASVELERQLLELREEAEEKDRKIANLEEVGQLLWYFKS